MTTGPTPTPKPSPASTGTLSPRAQEEIAARQGQSVSSGASSTGINFGSLNRGYDPKTGKPITGVIYKPVKGVVYNEAYINNMSPKEREEFQKKLLDIGAYPEGYVPIKGIVSLQDYDATAKLVNIGEQRGIGNINAVIDTVKKDKQLQAYLKTGGFVDTAARVVTDTTEAKSNLNSFFLDMFNDKPSKEEVKAYQNALNARERTAKGGMSAQERDDIILSIANKRLSSLTSGALTGDMTAADKLDEGQLGKRVREIRAQYEENGIPVSDRTAYKLAGKSFRNEAAWDTIQEDIVRSAALQWGSAAEGLKPGQTVRSRLQPYITIRSQIRGVPEDQIKTQDVTDALNADGTLKNISDYKAVQYKSDDYLNGDEYKSVVLNDTKTVLRNFGVM